MVKKMLMAINNFKLVLIFRNCVVYKKIGTIVKSFKFSYFSF